MRNQWGEKCGKCKKESGEFHTFKPPYSKTKMITLCSDCHKAYAEMCNSHDPKLESWLKKIPGVK